MLEPQQASAWARKAGALANVQRLEEALPAGERALALDPDAASAWVNQGIMLQQLGRDAEALAAFDRAVALGIETVSPWHQVHVGLSRCRLLGRLDRYAEALQTSDQLLAAQPDLALAWYAKAGCLYYCGRAAEAETALLRAKELAG